MQPPSPEKSYPPLSHQPSLKVEGLSSPPPIFENLVGGSTLQGRVHTMMIAAWIHIIHIHQEIY